MSYTPSEGHGAKAENRRGVPAAREDPRALKTAESAGLLDRQRSKISLKNSPLVPQADLGEAVPAHELFLRFELFGVIDERNGSEGVPPPEEAGTLF